MEAIKRVGQGIQRGANSMANAALYGINRAHEEFKNTAEDVIGMYVLMICFYVQADLSGW